MWDVESHAAFQIQSFYVQGRATNQCGCRRVQGAYGIMCDVESHSALQVQWKTISMQGRATNQC